MERGETAVNDKKRTALITGAGKGIGKAVAELLAADGIQVLLFDMDQDALKAAHDELVLSGAEAAVYAGDVSNSADVEAAIELAVQSFGRLDIVVNSAGIQTVTPFLDLTEEEWNRVMEVNLTGTFLFSQRAARRMITQAGDSTVRGSIINITSIHQEIPRKNKAHYDASKAGMMMLTKTMALELAEYSIQVNAVAPGAILTPMNQDLAESKEKRQAVEARIPFKRLGLAEEVAGAVKYLISSPYVTGSCLVVDGGKSLTGYSLN